MTDGRRFRILAIVDDCSLECLALMADTSLCGVKDRSRTPTGCWQSVVDRK